MDRDRWTAAFRRSLSRRLSASAVALSGLTLIGLAWFAYSRSAAMLTRAADENASAQVSAAVRSIDQTMLRAAAVARSIVALQEASGGSWAGSVYDVDRIIALLEAGRRALGRQEAGAGVSSPPRSPASSGQTP